MYDDHNNIILSIFKYNVNDEVMALYPPDGCYYKAKVISCGGNKDVRVRYNMDQIEKDLYFHQIEVTMFL